MSRYELQRCRREAIKGSETKEEKSQRLSNQNEQKLRSRKRLMGALLPEQRKDIQREQKRRSRKKVVDSESDEQWNKRLDMQKDQRYYNRRKMKKYKKQSVDVTIVEYQSEISGLIFSIQKTTGDHKMRILNFIQGEETFGDSKV